MARGRSSRDTRSDQKKVMKTLESWVQGPSSKTKGLATKAMGLKRRVSEDNQCRKEGFKDIRTWFESKGTAQEQGKERGGPEAGTRERSKEKEPTGLKPK